MNTFATSPLQSSNWPYSCGYSLLDVMLHSDGVRSNQTISDDMSPSMLPRRVVPYWEQPATWGTRLLRNMFEWLSYGQSLIWVPPLPPSSITRACTRFMHRCRIESQAPCLSGYTKEGMWLGRFIGPPHPSGRSNWRHFAECGFRMFYTTLTTDISNCKHKIETRMTKNDFQLRYSQ